MSGEAAAGDLEAAPAQANPARRRPSAGPRSSTAPAACSPRAATAARRPSEIARAAGVTEPILYRHFAVQARPLPRLLERPGSGCASSGTRRSRRSPIRRCGYAGMAIALPGSRRTAGRDLEPLDSGARRGQRRPEIRAVHARAPARGARVRRGRASPRAGGRRHPARPRCRRRGLDRSSRSGCCGPSDVRLGGLVERGLRPASAPPGSSGSPVRRRSTDSSSGQARRPARRSHRGGRSLRRSSRETTATTRRLRLCGPAASPGLPSPRISHPYLASRRECEPIRLYRHVQEVK